MKLYKVFRPLIFLFTPEFDHRFVGIFLSIIHRSTFLTKITKKIFNVKNSQPVTIKGLTFPNRFGMAAGFDKNGTFYNGIAALGAGFVEIGSVTLKNQSGNPKPRVRRLVEDKAIINHMGLNNVGAKKVSQNLQKFLPTVPIGISVAPNHGLTTSEMIDQMIETTSIIEDKGDFIILNLSCPNQNGVTSLQSPITIQRLLKGIKTKKPLFLKFSSDLKSEDLIACIDESLNYIAGIVLSNTTLSRENLHSKNQDFIGGLSGRPLFNKVLKQVKIVKKKYQNKLVIIHSGGIFSSEDAIQARKAGADLIQIYTGMIYNGPKIFKELVNGNR